MQKFNISLMLTLLLAGCNSIQQQTIDVSDAEDALVAAAESIERSMRTLAEAEATQPDPLLDISPLITPEAGLGDTISLDWSGPLEPLLHKLADVSDYRLRILGNAPPIPVMVTISRDRQYVAEVLKDAGLQAGRKASIVVYPATRTIELRYTG